MGIEPTTSCVTGKHSNRLNYSPLIWFSGEESNLHLSRVPKMRTLYLWATANIGDPSRTWTYDNLINSQAFYQLNYRIL